MTRVGFIKQVSEISAAYPYEEQVEHNGQMSKIWAKLSYYSGLDTIRIMTIDELKRML